MATEAGRRMGGGNKGLQMMESDRKVRCRTD